MDGYFKINLMKLIEKYFKTLQMDVTRDEMNAFRCK